MPEFEFEVYRLCLEKVRVKGKDLDKAYRAYQDGKYQTIDNSLEFLENDDRSQPVEDCILNGDNSLDEMKPYMKDDMVTLCGIRSVSLVDD